MSPTARTLKWCRDKGFDPVQVVEHWNAFSRKRNDLFKFVDVLGILGNQTFGIQTTSRGNMSARKKKIEQDNAQTLSRLKDAGWVILLQGWGKVSVKRGSKSKKWDVKIVEL